MSLPNAEEIYKEVFKQVNVPDPPKKILNALGNQNLNQAQARKLVNRLKQDKIPESTKKLNDAYKAIFNGKQSDARQSLQWQQDMQAAVRESQYLRTKKENKRAVAKSGETKASTTPTPTPSPMFHADLDVTNLNHQLLLENLNNVQLWEKMIHIANTKYDEEVNKKDKASLDILKGQTNHGTVAESRAYKAIAANLTNQGEKTAAFKKYKDYLDDYAKLNGIQKTNAYLLYVVSTDEFTTLPSVSKTEIANELLGVAMNGGRKKRKTKKRKGGKKKRKTRKKKPKRRKTRRKSYKKKKSRKTKRRR